MKTGKIAIVSGASSGIGKSCGQKLLEEGCTVVGIDMAPPTILHERYQHHCINVVDESAIVSLAEGLDGNVEYLVNSAGIFAWNKPFYELDAEEWDLVMDVNLKGTYLLTKHISKRMMENKRGKIVNVSCIRSGIFRPNMSEYASSKAAVSALTSTMALDLAAWNIQVNAVAPGFTYTGMTAKAFDQPDVRTASEALIPQGRLAQPEDISPVVMFLLSEGADYVNGTTVHVDGGFRLRK